MPPNSPGRRPTESSPGNQTVASHGQLSLVSSLAQAPPPIGQAGGAGLMHWRGWRIPAGDWLNPGHVIPRVRKAGERG